MPRICFYMCLTFSETVVISGAMVLYGAVSPASCCSLGAISDGSLGGGWVVGWPRGGRVKT